MALIIAIAWHSVGALSILYLLGWAYNRIMVSRVVARRPNPARLKHEARMMNRRQSWR